MNIKRRVYIIFCKYYDYANHQFTIGGIQTYLHNLIDVFKELGFECNVFGTGYSNYNETIIDDVRIVNIPTSSTVKTGKKIRMVLKKVKKEFCDERDLLLFATEHQIAKNKASHSIVIQHGISWDMPSHQQYTPKQNNLYFFRKIKSFWIYLNRICYAKRVVCVDYNYVNWYRALTAYEAVPMTVIPNFTHIAPLYQKNKDKINIIFARRLETYRGTRLISKVMQKILEEYDQVTLTIAGKGPDEDYMRQALAEYGSRVSFISYQSEESLNIHSDMHIAVIPTIGSEGTSLSLLEAMSAQCAVVCSNVGGMTNIVIDGYNGLMVSPREETLYQALKKLVEDEKLRTRMAERAYETVSEGFSLEKWKSKWKCVIRDTMGIDKTTFTK